MAQHFLLFDDFNDLSVKRLGEVLLDKFLGQFIQILLAESPEVVEKNALHALGADDFGEG